ncbi:MAG: metalloprotease [Candidatus Woesearchaeota archaeon]
MKDITPKGFAFSKTELVDLLKAWVAITIAFSIARATMMGSFEEFMMSFIVSAVVVGAAFLLHELAHKYMAIKYRCAAEFRANNSMLLMMMFVSLMGVILAAPGAVHIRGHLSRKEHGMVSLAGPGVNLALAAVSIPVAIIFSGSVLGILGTYSAFINSWLGMFNLIPFGMFDGRKILVWNREVYYTALVMGFVMVGISQFL